MCEIIVAYIDVFNIIELKFEHQAYGWNYL